MSSVSATQFLFLVSSSNVDRSERFPAGRVETDEEIRDHLDEDMSPGTLDLVRVGALEDRKED